MSKSATPTTSAEAMVVKTYESNSIEEVNSLVKQTIRSICLSGRLLAIRIVQGKGKKRYEVKCVFDNVGRRTIEEFDKEVLIAQQGIGLEDYRIAPNELLYVNREGRLQVEVLVASVGVIAMPVVIKRYYCDGLFSVNDSLQETLLQIRLSSAYTCMLLDFSIRRGEGCWLVELVMERLQGDLKKDIHNRVSGNNPYTEIELRRILECMAEALLFAKLRVRTT